MLPSTAVGAARKSEDRGCRSGVNRRWRWIPERDFPGGPADGAFHCRAARGACAASFAEHVASTARCGGFHLRHHHAGHAGDGDDRAGAAAAHHQLHGRQHGERRGDVRHLRDGLGGDAVWLFAAAGLAVGPLRAAADRAAVELWPGHRLPGDGAGADAGLAVCRARGVGHHLGERADGDGVHRGRDRPEEARGGLRDGERGLWAGICAGAGAGRRAGQREPAASLLGGGRDEPAECDVWPVCAAGVAEQGAPRDLLMEAGESDRAR